MIIAARFNGPPGSGNGGYSAGLVAARFAAAHPDLALGTTSGANPGTISGANPGGAIEVTLRRPPPLDTELTDRTEREPLADGSERNVPVLRVYDQESLVAEAVEAIVDDDELVPGVPFADAVEASSTYRGFASHPFPTCFVCGPLRAAGDGLRLFAGRLADGRTATPFTAPTEISTVLIWAALDCPGGWSVPLEERPYVLGRLAARIEALPAAGDECVVMGMMMGEQGRRAFVRTSLYSPSGAVLARARATWVAR